MAINTTTSLAGAVSGTGSSTNILTDNGTVVRIRDGQTHTLSDFDNIDLSIPSGEPIVGIEVIFDTAQNNSNEEAITGPWISVVSNISISSAKVTTAGNAWDNDFSDGTDIRIAGGPTDLWGLSWNSTTAEGISVVLGWSSTAGSAYYNNYVKVKVYYGTPEATPTYANSSDEQTISVGTIAIKKGLLKF